MDNSSDDVLALLREIRDLQKRHFERYVEFTTRVSEQQQRSAARSAEDTADALREQQRIGRALRQQAMLAPVIAVALAGCLAALAYLAFSR